MKTLVNKSKKCYELIIIIYRQEKVSTFVINYLSIPIINIYNKFYLFLFLSSSCFFGCPFQVSLSHKMYSPFRKYFFSNKLVPTSSILSLCGRLIFSSLTENKGGPLSELMVECWTLNLIPNEISFILGPNWRIEHRNWMDLQIQPFGWLWSVETPLTLECLTWTLFKTSRALECQLVLRIPFSLPQ